MNCAELARELNASTRKARELLRTGQIKAERKKRVWVVDLDSLKAYQRRTKAVIVRLKKEYVALYYQGATVDGLQRRAKKDFEANEIVWPLEGFAEKTIYESVMKEANDER